MRPMILRSLLIVATPYTLVALGKAVLKNCVSHVARINQKVCTFAWVISYIKVSHEPKDAGDAWQSGRCKWMSHLAHINHTLRKYVCVMLYMQWVTNQKTLAALNKTVFVAHHARNLMEFLKKWVSTIHNRCTAEFWEFISWWYRIASYSPGKSLWTSS